MTILRYNVIISLFCNFISIASFAQEADYFIGPQRYSFIRYDENVLHIPETDSSFHRLFLRFDSLIAFGNGKIRILHMGGSHIQADIYTHVMRMRLQSLSPDMNGGRGLIFPYRIARTNNPTNFSVSYTGNWRYCKSTQLNTECPLGVSGMAVLTNDSISRITINLNPSDTTHYTFDAVRIFHEPASYGLVAIYKNKQITGHYDSIGHYTLIEFPESLEILNLEIKKDTVSPETGFALLGIDFVSNRSGVVYDAVGVNGAMLNSYLRCELYPNHLHTLKPDLIIISIGTNDGYTRRFDEKKYRNEYTELLAKTREAVPGAAILLTVPNDSYLYRRYVNTNTEKMRSIIYDLAKDNNCAVWDFYTIMGGLNSAQTWYSLHLMRSDRIHFNRKGYQIKGDLLFSAFLKAWENQLHDFKLNELTLADENN